MFYTIKMKRQSNLASVWFEYGIVTPLMSMLLHPRQNKASPHIAEEDMPRKTSRKAPFLSSFHLFMM